MNKATLKKVERLFHRCKINEGCSLLRKEGLMNLDIKNILLNFAENNSKSDVLAVANIYLFLEDLKRLDKHMDNALKDGHIILGTHFKEIMRCPDKKDIRIGLKSAIANKRYEDALFVFKDAIREAYSKVRSLNSYQKNILKKIWIRSLKEGNDKISFSISYDLCQLDNNFFLQAIDEALECDCELNRFTIDYLFDNNKTGLIRKFAKNYLEKNNFHKAMELYDKCGDIENIKKLAKLLLKSKNMSVSNFTLFNNIYSLYKIPLKLSRRMLTRKALKFIKSGNTETSLTKDYIDRLTCSLCLLKIIGCDKKIITVVDKFLKRRAFINKNDLIKYVKCIERLNKKYGLGISDKYMQKLSSMSLL